MPEGQQGSPSNVPIPDPTVMTTEQLDRAVNAERDYVNGKLEVVARRFDDMDRATALLNDQVTQVPTDVDKQVGHLRELTEEKFSSVAKQFLERDTRSERESRDNKVAVDAAFAAQKEAASEQNKSNTLAITKSETATAETLNKLSELFKTTTDGLDAKIEASSKASGDKLDDMKERLNSFERNGQDRYAGLERLLVDRMTSIEVQLRGVEQNKQGGRESFQSLYLFMAILGIMVSIGLGIALALKP